MFDSSWICPELYPKLLYVNGLTISVNSDFIDMMARIFLWKDNSNYGVHLVGSNKVCKPKMLVVLGWVSWFGISTRIVILYGYGFRSISTTVRKCSLIWKRNRDNLLGMQLWKLSLLFNMTLNLDWGMRTPLYGLPVSLGVGKLADQVLYVYIHDLKMRVNVVYLDMNWNFNSLYTN